jgi:hypothetical protein
MATAQATDITTNDNLPGADAAELSLRDELEAAFETEPTDEISAKDQAEREADDGRARDQHGRFARGGKPAAVPATEQPAEGAQTAQDAQTTAAAAQGATPAAAGADAAKELKPPASWTPQAREEWASLSPRIKAEVHRRESEANRVVQDAAQARNFVQAFENVIRPYEMFIRAENSNPLAAVQNMMQTAAELRVGTPQAKAKLVAGIIQNFAIDVQALDSILAGTAQQGGNQAQQQFRDPRVDQLLAQQQQTQQLQEHQAAREVAATLADFAAKHEFYGDVSGLMADLIEVRVRQGQTVDMEQIYKHACTLHEGVAQTLSQRASQSKTTSNSNAVLRAKRAAASVRNEATPEGGHVPKDDSIRAALEAAMESAGGRI